MIKQTNYAVVDIETNLKWNTIWMAGVYYPASGTTTACYTVEELASALAGVDAIVGHNLIGFDLPVLSNVWGFDWTGGVVDTLVLSRLLNPSVDGGHSLKQCALRAGKELKDEFNAADFDLGLTDAMIDYCLQDCRANWDVYEHITAGLDGLGFSQESRDLEHQVATITKQQEINGFAFSFDEACALYNEHKNRMTAIEQKLQEIFPPIITERYSEKSGKRLKDKVEVFNPGSRQQVASRLAEKGAVWKNLTPTGKPKIDEKALEQNRHVPEAADVLEYLLISKRIGMVRSWIDACGEDGRIHGRVNTCGAVTGRMAHSKPNLAQIPSEGQYRELFTVSTGNKLVGIDASGLELRMLAHYMDDAEYTDLILNGDIHSYNQQAAGLPTRDNAKTFIYAFLYGAGDEKIGSVIGKGAGAGRKLKDKFLASLPALATLLNGVGKAAKKGDLRGLDGRRVHVRSEHAALNSLLQSAGAIVMKQALVLAIDRLDQLGYPYTLVAQVHDEFQVEVPEAYADRVGVVFRNSIRKAGRVLDLRCPLDGEYQIGDNWSQTH